MSLQTPDQVSGASAGVALWRHSAHALHSCMFKSDALVIQYAACRVSSPLPRPLHAFVSLLLCVLVPVVSLQQEYQPARWRRDQVAACGCCNYCDHVLQVHWDVPDVLACQQQSLGGGVGWGFQCLPVALAVLVQQGLWKSWLCTLKALFLHSLARIGECRLSDVSLCHSLSPAATSTDGGTTPQCSPIIVHGLLAQYVHQSRSFLGGEVDTAL